uniref:Kinesin-like protein n=1 Tax=Panagrolaimus sp. JU765 TaxID=591449 RepID=A0AC34REW1_9BILA
MAGPSECCIQVVCRVRPLNELEKRNGSTFLPKIVGKDTISIGGKAFVYDRVFDPNLDQEAVYAGSAAHIVRDVLNGYNGTIFAYGQTSSGKTHTMEGILGDAEKQGIIPRIVNDIFTHIYNYSSESGEEESKKVQFYIKVSYYEIYNEKIRDLLDETKTNLAIHEDKNHVPYVKGITEQFVLNPEEVFAAIEDGKNNRQVAVTNMNEHSSRSHSVFQIVVEQENEETQKKLKGKLYLVDLAGSEKVSKTGAEGVVLEEAKNINKSLSALGNVISALAEGTKSHVPYRDSKLTRILQESLGGNSRTTIVICCSPASWNEAETKSTLLFGQRAKTIKNVVVVNEELSAAEWRRRYERELESNKKLRAQLDQYVNIVAELRRFRSGEIVPESDWINLMTVDELKRLTESAVITASMSETALAEKPTMQPLLTSTSGPITDEDRRKYEEERAKLYQQLDEKDDEIQVQSRMAEKLKQQLAEQDELITQIRSDYSQASNEITKLQEQNTRYQEEAEELFSAIQEVAVSLETQKSEVERLSRENDNISADLTKKNLELIDASTKSEEYRDLLAAQKRKFYESVQAMLKELNDLGTNYTVPEKFINDIVENDRPMDDELLLHARLLITKLAGDYKAVAQRSADLKTGSGDVEKRLETTEKELSDCRLQIQQLDAKNKSLLETVEAQEKQKRGLEDELDSLNSRLSGATPGADTLSNEHQKLVAQLRDQIAEKNNQVKQLTDSLQELQLAKEKLSQDYEKLRVEEAQKEKHIKDLSNITDKREQAKQDLHGLEETVQKELTALQNLRKLFVEDIGKRIRKASAGNENEDEYMSSPAQKQKIQFLESNLEQLTKVHKQLVRDNTDLQCELPKLEKRLRASMERIKLLENALRETKENAMRDRKKYQVEVERIKEAVRQRNLARRGLSAQIAKPIRPGQHYATTTPVRPAAQPQTNNYA